jgi:hypothetical protein
MSSQSKRKFYRTVIQIEVLSEEPYSSTDLEKINLDITEGAQSGEVTIIFDSEEMNGKTCAEKLQAQGSDPDFFSLNIHGHDTEELEEELDEDDETDSIRKLKKD